MWNRKHHVFLTQSTGHDQNPHKRVGLDPTVELVVGRSDTGYQKDNRTFGPSLELNMVRRSGIQKLINFFGRFRQHTREIKSLMIIPVVKRLLRCIYPLQFIVVPDGKTQERNQISQVNIRDSILIRQTDRWQAREKYGTDERMVLDADEKEQN